MSERQILVYRNGRCIKTVLRPVHKMHDGEYAVYRKKRYPVEGGNRIYLDRAPGDAASAPTRSSQTDEWNGEGWDPLQSAVIEAEPHARLLVDAGPGTGKTAVACARVGWLMEQGREPSNIWLISFTRTAVAEIRSRIAEFADDDARAAAVRITTLDSHAWYLREGFDTESRDGLFTGYEQSIADALQLLRSGREDVIEYFSQVEHLVVDEAQDLVGVRADLVSAILHVLPSTCGVTVFSDDAQAIYGFSEGDLSTEDHEGSTLPERLRAAGGFAILQLVTVHRTKSPSLRRIFSHTRQKVLHPHGKPEDRLDMLIQEIRDSADGVVGSLKDLQRIVGDDTLVLFRRRAEVLLQSSFMRSDGVRHRVRMSKVPLSIQPWVALLLSDFDGRHLTEAEFSRRWAGIHTVTAPSEADAWHLLLSTAGDRTGRIEMRRLRSNLSRSRPPVQFVSGEFGRSGPILGTVHASKGREAPVVHVIFPRSLNSDDLDVDEECRVMFVAATRAREALHVGTGIAWSGSCLQSSGRIFRKGKGSPKAQVEIGMPDDLDSSAQASWTLGSASQIDQAQRFLRDRVDDCVPLHAEANRDREFRRELLVSERDLPIGSLTRRVNDDLFRIGEIVSGGARGNVRPSLTTRHLYMEGAATHVLAEDDPACQTLYPPYDETGIFLVPQVTGFPMIYYSRY